MCLENIEFGGEIWSKKKVEWEIIDSKLIHIVVIYIANLDPRTNIIVLSLN